MTTGTGFCNCEARKRCFPPLSQKWRWQSSTQAVPLLCCSSAGTKPDCSGRIRAGDGKDLDRIEVTGAGESLKAAASAGRGPWHCMAMPSRSTSAMGESVVMSAARSFSAALPSGGGPERAASATGSGCAISGDSGSELSSASMLLERHSSATPPDSSATSGGMASSRESARASRVP